MNRKTLSLVALTVLAAAFALPLRPGHAADKEAPERKSKATFEVYQDKAGEYRWRLRAQNSKLLAASSEGYKEKRSCLSSIESVKRDAVDALVVEQEQKTNEPAPDKEPSK